MSNALPIGVAYHFSDWLQSHYVEHWISFLASFEYLQHGIDFVANLKSDMQHQ
jgi:hypothetical protein